MVNMLQLSERVKSGLHEFKSGDFGLEDEERPGQPNKFEDEELEALLDEDCCKTQEELAESLGLTQAAISKTFKSNRIHSKARKLGSTSTQAERR